LGETLGGQNSSGIPKRLKRGVGWIWGFVKILDKKKRKKEDPTKGAEVGRKRLDEEETGKWERGPPAEKRVEYVRPENRQ